MKVDKKALRFSVGAIIVYVALFVALFFLMGEQLQVRESRGNMDAVIGTSETLELGKDQVVEQTFIGKVQILEELSVYWIAYDRPNKGTALVELINDDTGVVELSQTYDMAEIPNGSTTSFDIETPLENLGNVPLRLRISSPDGEIGSALIPLMGSENVEGVDLEIIEATQMYWNGEPVEGQLCFIMSGEDHIWTGLHYWEIVTVGGILLLLGLFVFVWRVSHGKKSRLYNALIAITKYRFLIDQLVARDFKTKYKRSVLGVLWSFLNPLLTMLVQYIVFSNLFRFDLPYYPVYLISGIVLFNFFSEASTMCLTSILGNSGLITKVYMPKYIYPLTRTLSSLVNLVIALIPLLGVTIFSGLKPTTAWLLLPFPLICIAVFSFGVGLLLSTSMVFFRDTQFLWGVLTMIWMYLTPIFYPASILPENILWVLQSNPVFYYIDFVRSLVIDGISPEPIVYMQCVLFALLSLVIGSVVFKKNQDKFVLYI